MDRGQHRPAHGERAGLVEDDHVEMGQSLQSFAAFEEDAELRAAAHGHGERGGHGQPHGAGTGDDQHGDGVGQSQWKRMRGDEPGHKSDERQAQHNGDKDGTGAVGQPLHGRARALRLLDHARDLRQHRGFAQRLRAANHGAVVVERAGQHAAADLARQRRGFAGEHGFVDGGAAFEDGGVDRKAFTGKNKDAVAGLNLFEGHDGLHAIHDAAGGYGTQPGERVERGQGAALGAAFEALAQEQKADDQQNRVEVDLATGRGPQCGVGGVDEGHAGSQADQRVHIGGAVAQGADGAEIDAAAGPGHDNRGEEQQEPAQRGCRQSIEPGQEVHERAVECAHLRWHRYERHGQQHGCGAGGEGDPGLASGLRRVPDPAAPAAESPGRGRTAS